jgi:hypothetical protein
MVQQAEGRSREASNVENWVLVRLGSELVYAGAVFAGPVLLIGRVKPATS